MSKNFLTYSGGINLGSFSSDPVDAVAGSVYFNTSLNKMKQYDGVSWQVQADQSYVSSSISGLNLGTASTKNVGVANGVATLDSGAKIPLTQLPASLMEYQGTWDASTNTPTLADGTGVSGYFYRVQVAGTQNLGSGALTFVVGDWVMYNGSIWQLAHSGADAVVSVNGAAGVVMVNAINQLSGDVTTTLASGSQSEAATVAKIQGTVVSGVTGSGNVVFSASPTLTGTISAASASLSGTISASNLSGTNTGDQTITLSSDVSGSGTGAITTIVNSVGGSSASSINAVTTLVNGSQSGNKFLASPSGGGSGSPAFRSIVSADVPTLNQNTTGTASNVTGTVVIANGGTGQVTKSTAFDALSPMTTGGDLIYGGASGTGTRLANGTLGQVLQSNGGTSAPTWVTPAVSTASSTFSFTQLINPSTGVATNFSNGTQTVTFNGSGNYKIVLNSASNHNNTYTLSRCTWVLGGTAGRSDIFGATINIDGIAASSSDQYNTNVIYGSFTNGQTITILPKATCTYSTGTHNFNASYLVQIIN